MKHFLLPFILWFLMSAGFAFGSTPSLEIQARRVDRVALQSQAAAAAKLKGLLKKYRGTAQESTLMMRLAQVYQESSAIEFRISYGKSPNPDVLLLKNYRTALTDTVHTINELLGKYPHFSMADEALFIRGKSLEDLGDKKSARTDYLSLTSQFSDSPHAIPAYMALADIAIGDKNHREAISYLQAVEKHPESPHYPFAIYKLAWAHFNLGDVTQALRFIERHVRYRTNSIKTNLSSEQALRENSLLDATLFYFEGYERGIPDLRIESALEYFRKLDSSSPLGPTLGSTFGKMIIRFAKLLRSHRHDSDLVRWKTDVVKQESKRPEALEVILTLFDHQWNQNQYEEMTETCRDIDSYFHQNNSGRESNSASDKNEGPRLAQTSLAEKAEKLQAFIVKEGEKGQFQKQLNLLKQIYTTFISIVPELDPRVMQAHFNLAETLFKISDYSSSTYHYQWILTHWHSKVPFDRSDLELKRIASRYEELRLTKKIPIQLSPTKLDRSLPTVIVEKLSPEVNEWISWIDQFRGPFSETLANFQFEANRTIYLHAGTRAAVLRLISFSEKHPDSKYTQPSQDLALDTLILTEDWVQTRRCAKLFLKKAPIGSEYSKRLIQLAADSEYKLIESAFQTKDYEKVLGDTSSFVKTHPTNPRITDGLFLMASSALALQRPEQATSYLSEIIDKHPSSPLWKKAILTRAQLADESYQWSRAVSDYKTFFYSPSTKTESSPPEFLSKENSKATFKRLLHLQWLTGATPLDCKNLPEADSEVVSECVNFQALALIASGQPPSVQTEWTLPSKMRELALKGPKENRVYWAFAALRTSPQIELRDQLLMLRVLGDSWEKLDSTVRFATLAALNSIIPEVLDRVRKEIKRANPMNRPTPRAVTLRAEWIKEFEDTVSKLLRLPWHQIQVTSLQQLALVYEEFVNNLATASLPKDLSPEDVEAYKKTLDDIIQPFTKKKNEISERAEKIAAEATSKSLDSPTSQTLSFQAVSFREGDARPFEKDTSKLLRALWAKAYQAKSWAECATILQELSVKKVTSESQLRVMRAMTLTAMGAQAEAQIEMRAALSIESLGKPVSHKEEAHL